MYLSYPGIKLRIVEFIEKLTKEQSIIRQAECRHPAWRAGRSLGDCVPDSSWDWRRLFFIVQNARCLHDVYTISNGLSNSLASYL